MNNYYSDSTNINTVPIIRVGEVISITDVSKSGRIKVRITGIDTEGDKELIDCVPLLPKYSSVPYFEWMRKRESYYEMILDLLSDDAIIWNILDKANTMKLFNDFIKRKNHLHKFILHIIDLEITLRLFFALKEDSEKIDLVSNAFKTEKSFQLKLSLNHLKPIVKNN